MSKYPYLVRWWPHRHPAIASPSFDATDWLIENCYILGVDQGLQKSHLDHLIELALKPDAEMDWFGSAAGSSNIKAAARI